MSLINNLSDENFIEKYGNLVRNKIIDKETLNSQDVEIEEFVTFTEQSMSKIQEIVNGFDIYTSKLTEKIKSIQSYKTSVLSQII